MTSAHLIFVYGTLKEGFPNFARNQGTRLPGDFVTCERWPLYLVGERYSPWLVRAPGQGEHVRGQVFTVHDAALVEMDQLERVHAPDGYQRVVLELAPVNGGQRLSAQAYLKAPELLVPQTIRAGPLAEYTVVEAALYRRRASTG